MIRRDFWLEVIARHQGTHGFGQITLRPPTVDAGGYTFDKGRPWWMDKTGTGFPITVDLEPAEWESVSIGDLFRVSLEETGAPRRRPEEETILKILVDGLPIVAGTVQELLLALEYGGDGSDLLGKLPLKLNAASRLEVRLEPCAVAPPSEDPTAKARPAEGQALP